MTPEAVLPPAVVDYRAERNIARAAEFLVAFDISRRGLACFSAGEGLRYDLLTDVGGLRRIQVKMNHRATMRAPASKYHSYTFGNKNDLRDYIDDVDLFAFVAFDRRLILYVQAKDIASAAFHVAASVFTEEAQELSLATVLNRWRDE